MEKVLEAVTIEQDVAHSTTVPIEVLEALLHNHLGDPRAVITSYTCVPFPHLGTNDSSTISRVTLDWSVPASSLGSKHTTWILKAWKTGGDRDRGLGILQPREALAWEHGWLRPSALPKGMVVPIVGTHRLPDNSAAWLVMEDVSTELSAYQRKGCRSRRRFGTMNWPVIILSITARRAEGVRIGPVGGDPLVLLLW